MSKPKRWSYSSVSTYKACPQQWKFSYIDGYEWPESPAMARGTRMHKMAEDFVMGLVPVVPHEIRKIGPILLELQMAQSKAEEIWLLDFDWNPVTDQNQAWVKAIIDVHHLTPDNVLVVKDYKSGQMYDDHVEQLELYGLMGLCKYPDVKRVDTSAVYMDLGHEGNDSTVLPQMKDKLIAKWHGLAETMMRDEVYEPTPSPRACGRCSFAKKKGGPCQY